MIDKTNGVEPIEFCSLYDDRNDDEDTCGVCGDTLKTSDYYGKHCPRCEKL